MKPFVKNRYLDSLIKTILLLAIIHVASLILFALKTGQYEVLNVFSILGLSFLFPQLGSGFGNFLLSDVFLILLYVFVLLY